MSAGGGCEGAVTAKTRYGWVKLSKCDELLHCRRCPLKVQRAIYNQSMFLSPVFKHTIINKYSYISERDSYARPGILYGCEEWCLKVRFEFYEEQNDPW